MADYTVIVDDHYGQVQYGPSNNAWKLSHINNTYKGTVHVAISSDVNLAFYFVGGQEVVIRGNFVGDNNASDSTTYPIFQVDSKDFLSCSPNPPQNGGQFLCSTQLSSTTTNRTLTMFVNPNTAIQQFHIDYIRHGSSSQGAASQNGTVVYVKAPDNTTLGLSLDSSWKYQSVGGTDATKKAMHTSTPSAKATHNFVGDSFAWWACCLPAGTSSNAANVTYRIDGGDALSVQVDENFIQSAQCRDEKILFQVQQDQIKPGNHTLEVFYGGDDTKMPLTLCALAAAPLNFSVLNVHLSNSTLPSSSVAPASTHSFTSQSSTKPKSTGSNNNPGNGASVSGSDSGGTTAVIISVIVAIVFAFLSIFIIGYVLRRKRARDVESRTSFDAPPLARCRTMTSVGLGAPERRSSATDSLSPYTFHPLFGFLDTEKGDSTTLVALPDPVMAPTGVSTAPHITDEQDRNGELQSTNIHSGSSPLGSRPPSYSTTRSLLDSS